MEFKSKLIELIGKNIRYIRENKLLTQTELSKKIMINKNYISDIERGQRNATIYTLERLAKGLGVEVIDFFNTKIS
ncbi:helix-turn-helix transcriptional regulator [Spiroplasma endosymbiont of Aspidapion aeneum]|uniref:helix-turn-helix domain-containing protein n=1 Tax=Spiroplasma endosymbiont of Aspidapion aeneum TaxID=3066276 RepID=UPI00313E2F68